MDTQATSAPVPTQAIHFANGMLAKALLPLPETSPQTLLSALDLPFYQSLILLAGGAAKMGVSSNALQRLFAHSIAPAAASLHSLIIDGGTQSGVMALIGQALAAQTRQPALLGVSPAGKVIYPGKLAVGTPDDYAALDPHHPRFILVETDEWGGETATMYALAQVISQHSPSVALLVNGGAIAKNEVLYNVRQQRPIVVLEGSGRLADEAARLWRERPTTLDDPVLVEIMTHGNLHLFPLTGTTQELQQVLRSLLQRKH